MRGRWAGERDIADPATLAEFARGAGLDPAALAPLESGVDRLALAAFDVYMQCREKIFEIRVREIKESQLLAARLGA